MPQDLDIKLDGESITHTSAELALTFDTPLDGFTASILTPSSTANPKLYKQISPYQGTPAEVYLEGNLKLTGALTKPQAIKDDSGIKTKLEGYSNTYNFADSQLKPPYEIADRSIHSICIITGRQTNTRIVHPVQFDTAEGIKKFNRVTARPGQTALEFCGPLAAQRDHVISSTPEGDLLLQQAELNKPSLGVIDESGTLIQKEFKAEWDLRKRFKTLTVKTQTPKERGQATATDNNIAFPRHRTVTANDDIKGSLLQTAEWNLRISIINELTQEVPVIGWKAPNGEMWQPGRLMTLVSETLFVPDGFEYFIRAVKYILTGSTKTAVLSLIPKEIYTGQPVVEPWFE